MREEIWNGATRAGLAVGVLRPHQITRRLTLGDAPLTPCDEVTEYRPTAHRGERGSSAPGGAVWSTLGAMASTLAGLRRLSPPTRSASRGGAA
jgi:hypothetical protein